MAAQPKTPLPPWVSVAFLLGILAVAWWQTASPPAPPAPNDLASRARLGTVDEGPGDPPIDVEVAQDDGVDASSRDVDSHDAAARDEGTPSQAAAQRSATPVPEAPAPRPTDTATTNPTARKAAKPEPAATRIENQEIRDQDGRVAYRGPIDLQPTLDRIRRGERNSHRNDGSVFQNRERRLPQQPSGYYREYVHPTKGLSGPGPQRVILGRGGEVWYTPDHYRTFRRIE